MLHFVDVGVHVHVIPRGRDLPHDLHGPRIFGLLGLPADECVPEGRMNDIAEQLQRELQRSH